MTTETHTSAGHLTLQAAIREALRLRPNMWADDGDAEPNPDPLAKAIAEDEGVEEYDTRLAANLRYYIEEQRARPWTGSPSLSAEDAYLTAFEEIEALL